MPWKPSADQRRTYNVRQQAIRRKIIDSAKDQPCMDCGGRFDLCAMDLDHPPGTREMPRTSSFARWGMSVGIERLRTEIAKCDVVCANCHRIRHFGGAHD